MSDSEHERFTDVTGESDPKQVEFYMEAAKGDLQAAVAAYFEASNPAKPVKAVKTESNRVNTFKNTNTDEDDENRTYAGGEKSGLAIQGPPKKGGVAKDLVKRILEQAAKGSETVDEEVEKAVFTGRGQRLGTESSVNEPIVEVRGSGAIASPEIATRLLTFWADGFTIEDGPLMRYDDPKNQEYLQQIKSGRAPTALLNVQANQPVEVKVAHRLEENYQPPPKAAAPSFAGQGQRLGSIAPVVAAPITSSSATPVESKPLDISIDATQPITSIQIRFGDGSRMVAKFNYSHTVGDLRRMVQA